MILRPAAFGLMALAQVVWLLMHVFARMRGNTRQRAGNGSCRSRRGSLRGAWARPRLDELVRPVGKTANLAMLEADSVTGTVPRARGM